MKDHLDLALRISIFLFIASYITIGLYIFYLTGL